MTHLQKITTLAKKIRKQHPNKKWTDCVKAASNELKVGKKVAGYTGTRRDGNKTMVLYTNKSATTKKMIGDNHQHFRTQIKLSDGNIYKVGSYSIDINTELKKHEKLIDGYIVNMNNMTAYKTVGTKKLSGTNKKHTDTKSHNINVKIGRLGEFFDTTIIKDLDALKKQYFKLAKKYHPDAGGTTMQFQQLQNEYEKLLKSLLSGSNFTDEQKQNEIQLDDAMRTIINSLVNIDDINIELIGKWLWISGNTYPIYTTLKSVGLQFIRKGGEPFWVYKGVESKSRGGTPIDEIRAKYGTHKITPPKTKKISGISLTSKQKNNLKTGLKKAMLALNKRPI